METVLIVIHLMVVLALVGVVLLQRSEGGGLGIGGGSGFMTARGAANALDAGNGNPGGGFLRHVADIVHRRALWREADRHPRPRARNL